MKKLLSLLTLIFTFSAHAGDLTQKWIKLDSPFNVDWKNLSLKSNEVLGYSQIIDKNDSPDQAREFAYFQTLDLQNTWKNRGDENYYIIELRSAYILDKPISFFTQKRVTDLEYIQELAPSWDIEQKAPQIFYNPGSFMKVPSCTFRIDFYSATDSSRTPALMKIIDTDPVLGLPQVIVTQKSYDFSEIMFTRTVKTNSVVTRHYELSPTQTLIVSDVINFAYNLPPAVLGGSKLMLEKLQKSADEVITHLRAMKE